MDYTATKEGLQKYIDKIDMKIRVLECDRGIFQSALYDEDEDDGKIHLTKEQWSLLFKYL